jgi:cytochrome P450
MNGVYQTVLIIQPLCFRVKQDSVVGLHSPVTGRDGSDIHEIVIPKGTQLFVGILAANVNPDLWGLDAMEFKPERWLDGLPDTISGAKMPGVYSNLMTFFGGARSCLYASLFFCTR